MSNHTETKKRFRHEEWNQRNERVDHVRIVNLNYSGRSATKSSSTNFLSSEKLKKEGGKWKKPRLITKPEKINDETYAEGKLHGSQMVHRQIARFAKYHYGQCEISYICEHRLPRIIGSSLVKVTPFVQKD